MSHALHPNQLRPGDFVREYRILRRLGVGGFSMVFLAEHEGHHYALKVALHPASDEDEDHVDGWMRREAVSLEHLAHPNLLPVHEMGRWPQPRTGYSFYVTDYVPGVTFLEWCRGARSAPFQWVGVLCEALRPLEAMHERGMCHRDLKADNILIRDGDDRPFLIDFGTVHLPCARPLTEGLAPGTLYCQPPEAIHFVVGKEVLEKGSRFAAHPSADLYAFGVLLYEALTGRHPFDPKLPVAQLMVAILTVPPLHPTQLNPEAPASLSLLAMRLLAKDPAERPSSARAVREELERLREQEGHSDSWRSASVPYTDEARPSQVPPAPAPESEDAAQRPPTADSSVRSGLRGRRKKVLAACALGLGFFGLVGWAVLHAGWVSGSEARRRLETTAPASPTPSEQGAQPVPSLQTRETPSIPNTPTEAPVRGNSLAGALLGVTVAQVVACTTVPVVRPDPMAFLTQCPAEARETPRKLGFDATGPRPFLYGSYIRGGTSASSVLPIEEGGPLNLKAGPVSATVHPFNDRRTFVIEGVAVMTRWRAYLQFDRIRLPEGTFLPICASAVSSAEFVFGIPTRDAVAFSDSPVDPAKVDHSPGTVVLNDPQFMTFFEPPPGERRANVQQVDPETRPDPELFGE